MTDIKSYKCQEIREIIMKNDKFLIGTKKQCKKCEHKESCDAIRTARRKRSIRGFDQCVGCIYQDQCEDMIKKEKTKLIIRDKIIIYGVYILTIALAIYTAYVLIGFIECFLEWLRFFGCT